MEDIKIYELLRKDLKGAVVIDGFPSVGLVSSIVANYLINALELKQIGIMDSLYFPTVSLVRNTEPFNPVRIYAGEKVPGSTDRTDQVVAFISEFQPPPNLVKPIATTMLDWAIEQKCSLMVSPEGLVIDKEMEGEEPDPEYEAPVPEEANGRIPLEVYGVGSTNRAREVIASNEITPFEEGVITGVAGVLLNAGKMRDFDVISILSEARPDYPDARAAAAVIETLDRLLPNIKLDAEPLYSEAERIENQLRSIHKQTKAPKQSRSMPSPSMYR